MTESACLFLITLLFVFDLWRMCGDIRALQKDVGDLSKEVTELRGRLRVQNDREL